MILEPIITFRGMGWSASLEAAVRERIGKLEAFCPSIVGCRVLFERAERRRRAGSRYHVRIELSVPGEDVVIAHDASLHGGARDIQQERTRKADEPDPARKHALVAIHEAFDSAGRRLQDYVRRRRGAVKSPARLPRGRIAELFPESGYGYIEAEDGHRVYFQASSVLKGAFARLRVGRAVSFVEESGEKGPQASTVKVLHPRRARRTSRPAA
jgi:cold shock CspA family protein